MASIASEKTPDSAPSRSPAANRFFHVDLFLRVFVFATTLTAFVVELASKESKIAALDVFSGMPIYRSAEYNHSPALLYMLVALVVTCVYSILSGILSVASNIKKSTASDKILLYFVMLDVVMVGLMASATGAGGAVAYIGLKGNDNMDWKNVCDLYGKFCGRIGASVGLSLVASIALLLLVMLSSFSLHRRC